MTSDTMSRAESTWSSMKHKTITHANASFDVGQLRCPIHIARDSGNGERLKIYTSCGYASSETYTDAGRPGVGDEELIVPNPYALNRFSSAFHRSAQHLRRRIGICGAVSQAGAAAEGQRTTFFEPIIRRAILLLEQQIEEQ